MATLKTNYKDDILDTSVNTQRKYRMVNNADGTISLEDVTVYTQNGDSFGAADINKTNQAVLDLNSSLNTKKCNFSYFSTGSSSRNFKLNGTLAEQERTPIIFYITHQHGYFCNYHIAILKGNNKIVPFKIAGDMDVTASFDFSTQILHLEYSKTGVWGNILFLTIDRFYITEV